MKHSPNFEIYISISSETCVGSQKPSKGRIIYKVNIFKFNMYLLCKILRVVI